MPLLGQANGGARVGDDADRGPLDGAPRVRLVLPENKDQILGTLTQGLPATTISRAFARGEQLPDGEIAMDAKLVEFTPGEHSLIERGIALGAPAMAEVRVFIADDHAYVVRDLYLDGDSVTDLVGRSLAVSLAPEAMQSRVTAMAVPSPQIASIQGTYTNYDVGVVNGKVSMGGCGSTWDGGLAVNDVPGPYTWVITGTNFGAASGTVTVAGQNAQVTSWSATRIGVNPTVPWYSAPLCAVVSVRTATGAVAQGGANIVPAILTRVYGQCTWFVAYTRHSMGMNPSPYAYQGFRPIDANYVPVRGDQLEWQSKHTAIITQVQGPFTTRPGGYTGWTVKIEEMNADCRNGYHVYYQTFEIRTVGTTRTVTSPIRSSIKSWVNVPTLYYR